MNLPFISFCGDLCSECPRYLATNEGNSKELEYLAELWYRLGFRDHLVSAEEMKCHGCSREKDCSHKINRCTELTNKNNCGECRNFPCRTMKQVFEKAEKVKEICREKYSETEYKILSRAFLLKKEILTKIHKEMHLG